MNQALLESIMDWEKFCVLRPIREEIVEDMGSHDTALVQPSNFTLVEILKCQRLSTYSIYTIYSTTNKTTRELTFQTMSPVARTLG
jgi:hypothetical protein